ncbi:MAG: efflux RND transporter periplasmic adaptor subunit, partial [Flammeovirgaceae bacterium]|nr:efflux RND transporter periplasmic adaptor subunit [Flammeovirgaceae bacterium]MDW8287344.1 efflux RND transporter periplasmic adaptor subunit [Flammeovirgaceae bacterium]
MKDIFHLLSICVVLTACHSSSEQLQAEKERSQETVLKISPSQKESIGIRLERLQRRNLTQTLTVNGIVDAPPQNLLHVSTFVGGFVKEVKVLQGSPVQKGQVLMVLEDFAYIQLQQEYLEKKSQLDFALAEYKRQELLREENINSLKNYQQAKANYETLQAIVAATAEKLKMLGIVPENITPDLLKNTIQLLAPKRGFVTNVLVNTGKYVQPSDVLLEMISQEGMHIELSVYEKDLGA